MLTKVNNKDEQQSAELLFEQQIDSWHWVRINWLKDKGLLAVPVYYEGVLSMQEGLAIERAFSIANAKYLMAWNNDLGEAYELNVNKEDIRFLALEHRAFIVLLFEPDSHSSILFTPEEFMVVCGTSEFIETAIGMSMIDAMQQFHEFATSGNYSYHLKEIIEKTDTYYNLQFSDNC